MTLQITQKHWEENQSSYKNQFSFFSDTTEKSNGTQSETPKDTTQTTQNNSFSLSFTRPQPYLFSVQQRPSWYLPEHLRLSVQSPQTSEPQKPQPFTLEANYFVQSAQTFSDSSILIQTTLQTNRVYCNPASVNPLGNTTYNCLAVRTKKVIFQVGFTEQTPTYNFRGVASR